MLAQTRTEVAALQCEIDCGLEHARLVASIVARALEVEAVDLFILQQAENAIGQLQFATRAGRDVLEQLKDARG